MGITGLLPILKPALVTKNLMSYKNKRVGIDGHAWLYMIAGFYAEKLFYNLPFNNHTMPFLNKIKALKKHKIVPVVVFDGHSLKSKAITNIARRERKDAAKEKVYELLKRGDNKRAKDLMRQCISLNDDYVYEILKALKSEGVEYLFAPYESDAQLCYLQKINYIDYIISEDSDMVAYGCTKVLYKLDGSKVQEYCSTRLKDAKDELFAEKILEICILSGCDYLSSVKGIGLLTAYKLMSLHGNVEDIVNELKNTKNVPENYMEEFQRAIMTFREQVVYDPYKKERVYLSGKKELEGSHEYLGSITAENVIGHALGNHLNMKKTPMEEFGIKVSGNIVEKQVTVNKINVNRIKEKTNKKKATKGKVVVDDNHESPFFRSDL